MISKAFVKNTLQKMVKPFLSSTKEQKRFIILHEVLPAYRSWFHGFLKLIDDLPATEIILTFDDGFISSFEAIKQLEKHKAFFFICPEFINRSQHNSWRDFFHYNLLRTEDLSNPDLCEAVRPASWNDLTELVKLGHNIGSHSMTHTRLSKLTSVQELEREIIGSADMIEDKLQIKVDSFSHPFGDIKSINERAYKIIKKRYKYFFTGVRGNNYRSSHSQLLWRDTVHFRWNLDHIEFLLRGGFDWYYFFQRMYVRKMM